MPVMASSETENTETEKNKYIDETADRVDYDEIQKVIDEVASGSQPFNFKEYVKGLTQGDDGISFSQILGDVKAAALNELNVNKKTIFQLIAVAIVAAIFTNFSNIFHNNQVADTAFYVTYLFMFSILTVSFVLATNIAINVLNAMFTFMKVLIPTYMVSVAFCAGARTSMVYYESTLLIITLINFLFLKIILPLINIYFVLVLANNLSKEDMLSKLAELLEMIITWSLKTLLAVVIGMNAIQALIFPSVDRVKNSIFLKSMKAIPGMGNAINMVSETVIGASVVVKNAIGVGGLIVILIICLIPIIKLVFYVFMYKFGTAIVQPISDKRILNCMGAASQAAKLLLSTVIITVVMFLFSIAIVATATNLRLT
ncbi:stage III sporulation protein AE [Lachnospiraceae bacterium KM106-2]|nr:stage III sporulation protein AE [Lachnospiraceae bacterium KM106-2]